MTLKYLWVPVCLYVLALLRTYFFAVGFHVIIPTSLGVYFHKRF